MCAQTTCPRSLHGVCSADTNLQSLDQDYGHNALCRIIVSAVFLFLKILRTYLFIVIGTQKTLFFTLRLSWFPSNYFYQKMLHLSMQRGCLTTDSGAISPTQKNWAPILFYLYGQNWEFKICNDIKCSAISSRRVLRALCASPSKYEVSTQLFSAF